MESMFFRDMSELDSVVERFEQCQFGKQEFTHARHLAVSAWYLYHEGPDEALVRMRTGLLRFTSYHGVSGYHETITRFWLLLIQEFLHQAPPDRALPELVNEIVRRYGRKEVLFEYYSQERIKSGEARSGWIEPDLRSI